MSMVEANPTIKSTTPTTTTITSYSLENLCKDGFPFLVTSSAECVKREKHGFTDCREKQNKITTKNALTVFKLFNILNEIQFL